MPSASCSTIDNTFSSHAGECRGGFDFTLLFEETILSILPLALLIFIAPLRIVYLSKKSIKVLRRSALLYAKVVSDPVCFRVIDIC